MDAVLHPYRAVLTAVRMAECASVAASIYLVDQVSYVAGKVLLFLR